MPGLPGSATALHLARSGARVLLVDRARFPRDKPCGGGLTGRALKHVPCGVEPVVERVVDRMVIRVGYRATLARGGDEPLIAMTQRRRLDLHLAEQAAAAGADFRDGVAVAELELEDDARLCARSADRPCAPRSSSEPTAPTASSPAQPAGRRDRSRCRARGKRRPGACSSAARTKRAAWVELGVVPGGYGWVFPKGDHANLGVGGWMEEGPRLRDHLERLARAHAVDPVAVTDVRGHRLPMRKLGAPAARGRALLVGDAAGLVDPLSGDGIYEAFVSARLAAEAIAAGRPEEYEAALSASLDRHAAAAWKAKRAVDRYPRACLWALRAPGVFDAVSGLLRGELAHPSEAPRIARPPLRALSRLARGI